MSVHTAQSTPCRAAGRCFVPAAHARRMSVSVAGHHAVVPSLAARPAAFLPAPASAHTLQQRRSVAARATLEGGDKDWYKKNLEVWTEIKSKADFDAIVTKNTPGKYKFVEFYASWCASCRTVYPHLCDMAGDAASNQHFQFCKANIDNDELKLLLKSLGVKAIPTIVVYSPDGVRLVEFGAGVKKLDTLRVNMAALISHKGQPVALDPNGLVVVKA